MNNTHYEVKHKLLKFIYSAWNDEYSKTIYNIVLQNNNVTGVVHTGIIYKGETHLLKEHSGVAIKPLDKRMHPEMDALLAKQKRVDKNKHHINGYLNRLVVNVPLCFIPEVLPPCLQSTIKTIRLPAVPDNLVDTNLDKFIEENKKEVGMIKFQLMSNLIQS